VARSTSWAACDTALELTAVGDLIRLDVKSHEDAPLSLKFRFVHAGDSLRVEKVVGTSSPNVTTALLKVVHGVISKAPQTARGLRKGVRDEGVSASNEEVDAAIKDLAKDGQAKNKGTAGKAQWVAIEPA
jgi:hypothetical protein